MGMEMSVSALEGSRNPWQRVIALLVADVPLFLVTAALLAFCLPLLAAYDISVGPSSMLTNVRLYGAAIAGLFVVDLSWRLIRHRPRSPTAFLFDHYRACVRDPYWVARLPLMAIAIVFMPFF